jgi:hypothetical protein
MREYWDEEDDRWEYDDDYPDDRPRRRRWDRPRRRGYREPHRGGTVSTLGILSLVLLCFPLVSIVLAILALTLGSSDISAMNSGRMDRSGRGQTNAGRICGLVALILLPALILFVVLIQLTIRGSRGVR